MIDIWNITILYISGSVKAVAKEVAMYIFGLVVVQLVTWDK